MSKSRNPYVGKGGPKLKHSVVAFIDILGYADLVRESRASNTDAQLLSKLHRALKQSRRHVDPRRSGSFVRKISNEDFSAFRSFTDNIVIGHPIWEDGEIELGSVFNDLSYFQMILTMEGFFVRGAIAIGGLYMDDIAVFGPGLIEAYEAEETLARDPRIVLTKSAKDAVAQHLKYYGRGSHAPQVRDLFKDTDGQLFVNYLDTVFADDGHLFRDELMRHKRAIEASLTKYRHRPQVWSKYMWTANYHNYFCSLHTQIDTDCLVNLADYQPTPGLIVG